MGEKKENKRSRLLSNDENEAIISMLGHKCQALATAVVQLMVALPESRDRWVKKTTGVACFVKDNPKRSYFIRIYDLTLGHISWEQELYTKFKYNAIRTYFHTFPADKYNAGLNFASEEEAKEFKQPIHALLRRNEEKKRKREEERRNQKNEQTTVRSQASKNGDNVDAANKFPVHTVTTKKRRRKLTKEDIGEPANFKHIEHIGWNPDAGFSVNVDMQDEKWKTLLAEIGVTKKQLKQKSTREYIYDFVQKEGGIDEITKKIRQEKQQGPPPLPPSRGPHPTDRIAPPPPPPRGYTQAPPPPTRTMLGRPPPPPSRGARQAPPTPAWVPPMAGVPPPPPPPPPSSGAPPPPPPPIVGISRGGPPAPPPPPLASASNSNRGDLLQQIQQGKALKCVGDDDKRRPSVGDRSDLLSEIQKGTTLKKVTHVDGPRPDSQGGGILGALQMALAKRDNAIHSSDDETDSETEYDSDEDEWND